MRKKKRGKKTDTKIQNKRGKNGEIKKTNKWKVTEKDTKKKKNGKKKYVVKIKTTINGYFGLF